MNITLPIAFDSPAWRPLVLALLHTIWQGGLLALLLSVALRRLPAGRTDARYLLSMAAQFGVVGAWLITWSLLSREPTRPIPAAGPRPVQATLVREPSGSLSIPARANTTSPPIETPAVVEVPADWVGLTAAGWMAGVALMLARAAASAASAMRLGRAESAVDATVLDAVDRIRHAWKIRRPVRVVVTVAETGPAVLGLLRPTLLLPLSLMTGLAPDTLQAILAHELAHIRRHDYAWNLAQMCVESLLFFNPAVWWLGRQARQEREACCDAEAVNLLGRPLDYSRALAAWAERAGAYSRSPAVMLSWSGRRGPSSLFQRIIRILRPSEPPRTHVSWGGLALLLVACPLLLLALKLGTVAFSQILPAAERIEKIERAREEYSASRTIVPQGKGTLRGTLRTRDDKPWAGPPVPTCYLLESPPGNVTSAGSFESLTERFSVEVANGRYWLILYPDEYAPVVAGPYDVSVGAVTEGVDLTIIERGFTARIRVVDEQGAPVVGARISGGPTVGGNTTFPGGGLGSDHAGLTTDAEGFASVEHASDRGYHLSAQAPGYRSASSVTPPLSVGEPTTLTLVKYRAKPAKGRIVDPEGTPVAGARLGLMTLKTVNGTGFRTGSEVIATTGVDGRFELRELEDETIYGILVTSDRHGRGLMTDVRAGQEDLRFVVGPRRAIQGTIKGSLESLKNSIGEPVVTVWQHGTAVLRRATGNDHRFFMGMIPVKPEGDGGRFVVEDVLPGEVVIQAGDHVLRLEVDRAETAAVIDLTRSTGKIPTRTLIIRLVAQDSSDPVTGSIVGHSTGITAIDTPGMGQFDKALSNGEVRVDVPTDCLVFFDAKSVNGYWFPYQSIKIPPGEGPLSVTLEALPAGAIVGQVFNVDGTPASRWVNLFYQSAEPSTTGTRVFGQFQFQDRPDSRFFLGPLPLGRTYVLTATQGNNQVASPPIKLDGRAGTVKVDLRFAATAEASGRVAAPDGRPLAGIDVHLELENPSAINFMDTPTTTDRDGRFRFSGLNSGVGPYYVRAAPRRDYQPAQATVVPGGAPAEIKLERGRIIEGRVLDAVTGWPIPGVDLSARLTKLESGVVWAYKVEAKTDADGRFRFSNLTAKPMTISVEEGRFRERGGDTTIDANSVEPIEFRVTLGENSVLRPRRPGGK
jgi:beta-lactamase regulating signal transducer with metallopeptidase domain